MYANQSFSPPQQMPQQQQSGGLGDPNLMLGLALMAAGNAKDPTNAMFSALSQMQQAQQFKNQLAIQQLQYNLDVNRFNLAQKTNDRQQQEFDNTQKSGSDISSIIGHPADLPHNFQGQGLLANDTNMNPVERAKLYTAQALAESGKTTEAAAMLPSSPKPTFGQPVLAMDASGNRAYIMTDNNGDVKEIPNFKPAVTQQTATPIEKEMAAADIKELNKSRESVSQALPLKNLIDEYRQALNDTPDSDLGRIAGNFSPYYSSKARRLETIGNKIALMAKGLLGMPSNTFSEADREFLVKGTVSLYNDRNTNIKGLDTLDGLLRTAINYNNKLEQRLSSGKNLLGLPTENYRENANNDASRMNQKQQSNQDNTRIDFYFNPSTGGLLPFPRG